METPTVKNGVYKSPDAVYFVKEEKVIMILKGSYFKTTKNFMAGADFEKDLPQEIFDDFERVYKLTPPW